MPTGTYRIAVIPGDGIGKEVVPQGLRVLERLAERSGDSLAFAFETFPWGCEHYLATGRMMDADGLERLSGFDAIYFGAVGWPGVPDHVSLWGLRLAICQGFDQYACIRPVRLLPGITSPLRNATEAGGLLLREALMRHVGPFSLLGAPVLAVPAALRVGLPLGVQILARPGADRELIALALHL